MTIVEAGIIAGGLTGAVAGALLGAQHGWWSGTGAAAAGIVAGAVAGWSFAYLLIALLSIISVLWRAASRHPDDPPTESDIRAMTPVAIAGTFVSAFVGVAVLMAADWSRALVSVIASACLTALIAVANCELRGTG